MRLSKDEALKALAHCNRKCPMCGDTNYKIAPVLIDMLQQGSALVENDYILFSLVAAQCETCKNVQFFNKNILRMFDENKTTTGTAESLVTGSTNAT